MTTRNVDKLNADAEAAGFHVDTTHPSFTRIQQPDSDHYYTIHYTDGVFTEAHRWTNDGTPAGDYKTIKAVRDDLVLGAGQ